MLPMGTIMAGSMILGLIFAIRIPALKWPQVIPSAIRKVVAAIMLLAGSWNTFWYASQHLGEFWGNAALASGVLMLLTSLYIFQGDRLPQIFRKARPFVLVMLFGCSLLYGVTIYQL